MLKRCAIFLLAPLALGQPKFDMPAIERGRAQFKSGCGFCHVDPSAPGCLSRIPALTGRGYNPWRQPGDQTDEPGGLWEPIPETSAAQCADSTQAVPTAAAGIPRRSARVVTMSQSPAS